MTKEELAFEEATEALFQDDTATAEGATDEDATRMKATPQEAAKAALAAIGCRLTDYTAATRADLPELAHELVEGILREGHTMILSGPTKAGKSMLGIELALAVSEGGEWLGHKCEREPVLYVNCEVCDSSFARRIYNVRDAMGLTGKPSGDLHVLDTRGTGSTLSDLRDPIIALCKAYHIGLVILDPIYLLLEGDENSNSDARTTVKSIEAIAENGGCAVCFIHHFGKGNAAMKSAMDRSVGAGVFTRSPDAIITMSALDVAPPAQNPSATAYRMDMSLREFRNPAPFGMWYSYPVHVVDHSLDGEKLLGTSATARTADDRKENSDLLAEAMAEAERTGQLHEIEDGESGIWGVSLPDVTAIYETLSGCEMKRSTMQRRLAEAGYEVVGHYRNGRATTSLYGLRRNPIMKHDADDRFFGTAES